jgi:hypothetical protein
MVTDEHNGQPLRVLEWQLRVPSEARRARDE